MTTTASHSVRAEQDALPPLVTGTPAGNGAWDLTDEQRRVLALRAEGLSIDGCAQQSGLSPRQTLDLLSACAQMAGVTTHRALIHEALRAGVLVLLPRPATPCPLTDDVDRAVLRRLVLDVPPVKLRSAIMRSARCSYRRVCACLDFLRRGGVADCRLVVLGWQWGVLDAAAPVLPEKADPGPSRPVVASATTPVRSRWHAAWNLSDRQDEALGCVLGGMTDQESAERLGINPGSFRGHLTHLRARAGVDTDRALVHRALVQDPPSEPQDCPSWCWEVSAEVREVWREIALDVPDSLLANRIAMKLRLPQRGVDRALTELRRTGLSDRQLVLAGWACGVLDAHAATTPPTPAVLHLRPDPNTAKPRAALSRRASDAFLPDGVTWHAPHPPTPAGPRLQGRIHGSQFALLIVDPGSCRALLQQVGPSEWGPVLVRPETGTALLIAHAGSVPAGWRSARGRRATARTVVPLPSEGTTSARAGTYWAVPPAAPLWDSTRLQWLIGEPGPITSGATRA